MIQPKVIDSADDSDLVLEALRCRLNRIYSFIDPLARLAGAEDFFLETLPRFCSILSLFDLEAVEEIHPSPGATTAILSAKAAWRKTSLASHFELPSDWSETKEEDEQTTYIPLYSTWALSLICLACLAWSSTWSNSLPSSVPGSCNVKIAQHPEPLGESQTNLGFLVSCVLIVV